VLSRLRRMDQRGRVAWTHQVLTLIARHPGVPARVLARRVGMELLQFKRRVRHLKTLGLTESLEVGYRLSPRGRDTMQHLT
jgi:hypothetical protein